MASILRFWGRRPVNCLPALAETLVFEAANHQASAMNWIIAIYESMQS
jgi:hypothetical protein